MEQGHIDLAISVVHYCIKNSFTAGAKRNALYSLAQKERPRCRYKSLSMSWIRGIIVWKTAFKSHDAVSHVVTMATYQTEHDLINTCVLAVVY